MQLNFKQLGTEGQPIIILHGLFGSLDNWYTIAKQLANNHIVYLLDQRNHGASPWSEEWNYDVMSTDLQEFIQTQQIQNPIIIGHSMGGKTAMMFAGRYAQLDKLIVVDISPRAYGIHNDEIAEALSKLQLTDYQSRKEVEDVLASDIPELGTRQFLLKNLYRTSDNQFAWRMNLELIRKKIAIIIEAFPDTMKFTGKTLFIRGQLSHYIQEKDIELINKYFPDNQLITISEAGHWVHAEKPMEVLKVIQDFIKG